jgi:DNA-binding NarL/FixJ family response regulator
MPSPRRTVLIVDDHAGFRRRVRAVLQDEGYDVVGEAPDGETAIRLAADLCPDVVLLDVVLPGLDGFETCERLLPGGVGPVVVLTSTHDPSAFRARIAASRARGFLPKAEISGSALDHLAGGTR